MGLAAMGVAPGLVLSCRGIAVSPGVRGGSNTLCSSVLFSERKAHQWVFRGEGSAQGLG